MLSTIRRSPLLFSAVVAVLALLALTASSMQPRALVAVLLSGLTLGALYFIFTAGLSLIFGLMDVLNFAHGVIFMLGAYAGFTLYQNPRTILNLLPLLMALGAGVQVGAWCIRFVQSSLRQPLPAHRYALMAWRAVWMVIAAGLVVVAFNQFPLSKLIAQSATATGGAVPTVSAQEADDAMLGRLLALLVAGMSLAPAFARRSAAPAARPRFVSLLMPVLLAVLAVVIVFQRTALEQVILSLSSDLRFVLALVFGALAGAGLGGLMEFSLIRPLYARPIYQVLLTLGLVFVGDQFIKFVWGPSGYFMEIPALFNGQGTECPSNDLLAWFGDHCASIMIMGRGFPSYRLFLIMLGFAMLAAIGILLSRTRIGMIIRAGVQDAEMVEALGINVRRVFTGVFALGAGLAALGGVAAAPMIGVNPAIGGEFLLQGFISVVIGGMGSLSGAAIGALLVGLGRAFGDNIVLSGIQLPWMEKALTASTAIARASTVLIMALVLLLRPSGIFGKKD